jgi:hypothetical protein
MTPNSRTLIITALTSTVLGAWLTSPSHADGVQPAATPDNIPFITKDGAAFQKDASDWITKQFGPFKFTTGPNSSGAFAANLDGKGEKDGALGSINLIENVDKFWFPAFYNIGYATDGTWSSDPKAPSNFSLSLKPGLDGGLYHGIYKLGTAQKDCPLESSECGQFSTFPHYWLGLGGYLDLQYRYGTIQQNSSLEKVNQFNAGAGLFAVVPVITNGKFLSIDSAPRLSATYYHPISTTGGTLALPSGVTANYLQTEFHVELGILPKGSLHVDKEDYPFKLDIRYDASKPLSGATEQWQSLWKLQLYTAIVKSGNTSAAITYQTGRQAGFTYDHQVILGILVHFLDPKATQ